MTSDRVMIPPMQLETKHNKPISIKPPLQTGQIIYCVTQNKVRRSEMEAETQLASSQILNLICKGNMKAIRSKK